MVIFVEGSVDPKPATFWGSGHGRYPQLQRHAGDGGDWTGDDRGWLNGLNGSSDQKCGQDQQPEVYYPLVNIYKTIENGPFIVDLPIENGDVP